MNIPVTADVRVNYDEVRAIVDRAISLVAAAQVQADALSTVGMWIPGEFPNPVASDYLRAAHNALLRMRNSVAGKSVAWPAKAEATPPEAVPHA